MARPRKEIDQKQFENLCGLQCTLEEICGWFDVTDKTLDSWCKRNYRGAMWRILGAGLNGNLIYHGKSLWSVESMGTDSPATVMLDAIAHRGGVDDTDNIKRLCATKKFWTASAGQKEATLCKYFDMDRLFGAFTPETLPSRYLSTYAKVEKMWGKTPLEVAYNGEHK